MKRVYLLSGVPGVGKTSLIKEAIAAARGRAGGFYTQEIRKQGIRLGFEIITLDGYRAVLASVDFPSPNRVSKYGVDTNNLDKVGVSAVRRATQGYDIVVIDEIGKMELFSSAFREAVLEAIDSGKKVLGTIMLPSHPWADKIKQRPEVKVLQVSRANRQQVLGEVMGWLGEQKEGADERQ
jgi:nucleoside-triphosphatase